ncbi:hypothetical protein GCM10010441_10810 [Kitasatospora paracochleata]|uniref:Protein-glutamine gamma-glutamyltransferase-like C-terminal domain-containing protein n=1 Tax=Kitasatospora paracochleata TaxID=58354 RepID=A0ABT1J289_9ACTN|nr:DUF4129 domain-containing protein [Kitasatospora paracochleata]MCP2311493.1 hypothetical protein [Kitasatospora paracochleata]
MSRTGGTGRRGAVAPRTAGTAAACAAVLGLALAALALHPDADPPRGHDLAPLAHHSGLIGLLVAGTAVLLGVLARRFRAGARSVTPPNAVAERLVDAVGWLLVAGAVLLPVALLLVHGRDAGPAPLVPDLSHPTPPPMGSGAPGRPGRAVADLDSSPPHSAGHLGAGLIWLGLAAVVAAAVVFAVRQWRRRGLAGPAPVPVHGTGGEATAGLLAEAVASGRAALLGGSDPRSAVIACYRAMETSLADAGVDLLDSDSPTDLLSRAARTGRLDDAREAQTLAELFREARYSTHPMDAGHVRRAGDALDAIAARLDRSAAAPEDAR